VLWGERRKKSKFASLWKWCWLCAPAERPAPIPEKRGGKVTTGGAIAAQNGFWKFPKKKLPLSKEAYFNLRKLLLRESRKNKEERK
jgi:hypothetical protein